MQVLDAKIREQMGTEPEKTWSFPLTVAHRIIKSYLKFSSFSLTALRAATSTPSFVPSGVKLKPVLIPRDNSLKFHDIVPEENGYIKADLLYEDEYRLNPSKSEFKIILYLHGGGYFLCSRKTHRLLTGTLAKTTKTPVIVPEYRKSPESTYPKPLQDACSAFLFLLDPPLHSKIPKFRADQIFVAGDSAGGGMCFALMYWLRDHPQYGTPAGIIGLSPWLDLTLSHPSFILNRPFDYLTSVVGDKNPMERDPVNLHVDRAHYYVENNSQLFDYYVSPVYASPDQSDDQLLPPILIQIGSAELLRDESISYFCKTNPNGKVQVEMYQNMLHVFQVFGSLDSLCKFAVERIAQFIRTVNHQESVDRKFTEICKVKSDIVEKQWDDPYSIVESGHQALNSIFDGNATLEFLPVVPRGVVIGKKRSKSLFYLTN